jgi:hypothetical protein
VVPRNLGAVFVSPAKAAEVRRTAMSSVKTWLALRFFCFFLNAVFVFPFRLSVFKTFPWRGQRRT